MDVKRSSLLAIGIALALSGAAAGQTGGSGGGYSYIREATGDVRVESRYNGTVTAGRNMPISVGDEIVLADSGRAEVSLADHTSVYFGGGTRAQFRSIRDQQGEDDAFSMINLDEGSLILAALGSSERGIPRIDTADATIYLDPGDRVRVNYDPNRGTVVVSRDGTVEVRTRSGTYHVRAGEYLMARGEEEPEIERGVFSRDRFDLWAADRLDAETTTRSASASSMDEGYANEASSLDGYGNWEYNDTTGSDVWRPNVGSDWSPYSNGTWYYTPAGLTWWPYDPWGWYPFHYGNWFYDASWSSWCWAPAYVYSPGWVYWGYTGGYVGWCPVGWYSYYSPWCNTYYKHWGWTGRGGVYLSVNGRFNSRNVDFRGWNFTGSGGLGAAGRMDVIPGSRMGGRLGDSVSISSRPIVAPARPGAGPEAVQGFVREAPRVIDRTSRVEDSGRLAPILARDRTLPASSVDALRDHAVIAERGRLAGPGAADIAPRGALVDRSRSLDSLGPAPTGSRGNAGGPGRDASPSSGGPSSAMGSGSRNSISPRTVIRGDANGVEARSESRSSDDWRSAPRYRRDVSRPSSSFDSGASRAPARDDWRARMLNSQSAPPDQSVPLRDGLRQRVDEWRSRSSLPPARRVIEGSVPNRRDPRDPGVAMPTRDAAPRDYRSAPPPRSEVRSAPAPRSESRSAPAPRSEMRSAPRSAPPPAPRPAPAPAPHGRNRS